MNLNSSYTIGHQIGANGTTKVYEGTTTTEGLAIGQKVSTSVLTSVDTTDKLVVSDLDPNSNLSLSFGQQASGQTVLEITNANKEFQTKTTVPVELDADQVSRGQKIEDHNNVQKVTVSEVEGFGTVISMADGNAGERPVYINDGKLVFGLRGA